MSKTPLFLAIDLGTSGIRVGVFDAEGRLKTKTGVSYETRAPRPGWVEQNPEAWWVACREALKKAANGVDAAQIEGIGVTGLSPSLVCLDERGAAVRPASIWSDRRAVAEIAELSDRLGPDTAFSPLPRLLWLKRNEPENYRRTQWVFDSFDYLSFKLTGQVIGICPIGDQQSWTVQDLESAGLDPQKFPSRVCKLGDVVGGLAPDVAVEVGLPSGLPIVAGTIDSFVAWIGTATTRKGIVCNTVGTSDGVALVWDQPISDPRNRLQSLPHITGQGWIVGGAMSSGGIMLDWFVRRFYQHDPRPFETALEEATSVPVGSEGLVALPYLVGERSPIFDPNARSVFFGVAETHTRAHFARAALESVAFAVRDVCEVIREFGAEIEEVRVAGGAANSNLWSQIKADVLGRRVLVPEVPDSSLLGAAIIAGWGVQCFGDLSKAAQTMVRFRTVLEPNPTHHETYSRLFEFYRGLYAHLKEDFARLAGLSETKPLTGEGQ